MAERKYTAAKAEKDGWVIIPVREEAVARKAGITGGGHAEFVLEDSLWRAEKTQDNHLISEQAATKELLLDAIESRQASLNSGAVAAPAVPVLNDNAGDAGSQKNVGVAGILKETAVRKPRGARELEVQQAKNREEVSA